MKKNILFISFMTLLLASCASATGNIHTSLERHEYAIENVPDFPLGDDNAGISVDMDKEMGHGSEYVEEFYIQTTPIQDLFNPMDAIIMMEGTPVPAKLYPFGEIATERTDGRANFVIFIEKEYLYVEQSDNLLILSPTTTIPEEPPTLMEITQVPDFTADEMVYKIKNEIDFDALGVMAQFSHHAPTEDFPFAIIMYLDVGVDEGLYHNTKLTRIFIKDNFHGGVFVITTQHSFEAIGGWGVRFRHYLGTLEIIDK